MYTIYRVEDEHSRGPYGTSDYPDLFTLVNSWAIHTGPEHPSRRQDFPEPINEEILDNYHCACSSMESLEAWFKGYLDILAPYYSIVEIQVTDVKVGKSGKQCFYTKDNVISKTIVKNKLLCA